jgi:hypothetical protein
MKCRSCWYALVAGCNGDERRLVLKPLYNVWGVVGPLICTFCAEVGGKVELEGWDIAVGVVAASGAEPLGKELEGELEAMTEQKPWVSNSESNGVVV